jgi:hypothetical protein
MTRWDQLRAALIEERTRRVEHVSSGGADSFDTYRGHVGSIKGITFALDEMDRLSKERRPEPQQTEDDEI